MTRDRLRELRSLKAQGRRRRRFCDKFGHGFHGWHEWWGWTEIDGQVVSHDHGRTCFDCSFMELINKT